MSYLDHFKELRNRLILSFLFLFICFIFFFYNAEVVANFFSKPLFDLLDQKGNKRMIFTGLPEVFISYMKISFFAAFLTSFPFFRFYSLCSILPTLHSYCPSYWINLHYCSNLNSISIS